MERGGDLGQGRVMRRSIRIGLLLLLAGVGGCMTPETSHKLTWRTLSKGLTSGVAGPRRVVVREEAAFLKLWAEHAAESPRMALPPKVDFGREMVVVVVMGEKPTGGYLTDVVDAEIKGRRLRVLVGEREPSPGQLQIQAKTQPYVMVALPAVRAAVDFRTVRQSDRPRAGAAPASNQAPRKVDRVPANATRSPRGAQQ